MTRANRVYFIVGLIFTLIGFLAKSFYREHIITNGIHDYGLADLLPSYLYVIGFPLMLLIKPNKFPFLVVSIVCFASVLFEIMQYASSGLFDTKDAIASVMGGLTSALIYTIIERRSALTQNP